MRKLTVLVVTTLLALLLNTSVLAQTGGVGSVPTPQSVIGYKPGTAYHLFDFEQLTKYFHALAAASPRIRIVNIGTTGLGRTEFMAVISSAANLKELQHYRQLNLKLALGTPMTSAQAHQLADQGKVVVWYDGGMHSTEVAGTQHMPETAYWLVTSESALAKKIRSNVIILLNPCWNPDGLDIVAHWYMKNVHTPYELAPVPRLWNKYVGHDNNRDMYKFNQVESRNAAKILFHEWVPEVVYNQHEAGVTSPRITIPPYADELNPNIPSQVVTGDNEIGTAMAQAFAAADLPGFAAREGFTMWWDGGMREAPYYHNQIGVLTEVATSDYATPFYIKPGSMGTTFHPSNRSRVIPSIMYPMPWTGGWWTLADQDKYMDVAGRGLLNLVSHQGSEFLYNSWAMARQAIEAGKRGDPYAFIIPPGQHDPAATQDMLFSLQTGGIQIRRATAPFTADGQSYPAGTNIIFASQPFRASVIDLLTKQHFPKVSQYPGGPPKRPYDMTGWTMPLQMGVKVARVNDSFTASTEATTFTMPTHRVDPPAGEKLGRVGLYASWMGNMDEGQTRYVFDHWHIPYTKLRDANIRAGGLRAKFDTIVLPDQTPDAILHGWQQGSTRGFFGAGRPIVQRPQYLGGIGVSGLDALFDFTKKGGTLLCFDHACDLLIQEFGLPVRNVLLGLSPDNFYAPGSLLRIHVDTSLPEGRGMQPNSVAFFVNSSAYTVWDDHAPTAPPQYGTDVPPASTTIDTLGNHDGVKVFATYGTPDPLLSGSLIGPDHIAGKVAGVSVPVGQGRVVLIGFRPQFRAQPENTYPLIFNALMVSVK